MLKIRLMRIGAKKRPFYRVVVVDERNKRNSAYIELIGTYNPLTAPKEVKLNQERLEHWIKQGAQKSDGLLRILKEAPQRPARKPKKAAPEPKASEKTQPEAGQPLAEAEEVKAEETPAETPAVESTSEKVAEENQPVEATETTSEEAVEKKETE